ncbi:hypothetical protein B0H11DRAFT_2263123 [Mycena galericulata]|nr:hypothetical protein B0H11DRAFT_2263123 [Mycena galericulata]
MLDGAFPQHTGSLPPPTPISGLSLNPFIGWSPPSSSDALPALALSCALVLLGSCTAYAQVRLRAGQGGDGGVYEARGLCAETRIMAMRGGALREDRGTAGKGGWQARTEGASPGIDL